VDECAELALRWQSISASEEQSITAASTPDERCARLGAIWEPDFLLLQDDEGVFVLLAGCVCFPSSWDLAEKIGKPIQFIHGVVPGLNAQLGRPVQSVLQNLTPETALLRHNWGFTRSPELNQHPERKLPRLDASVGLDEVWLRVEHQSLVRLPRTGGVLFGIRIAMHSLAEVKRDDVTAQRLANALRTMPEPVAAYKGLALAREKLLTLIQV
jgi:dimethylamine monooxygenase subunit A